MSKLSMNESIEENNINLNREKANHPNESLLLVLPVFLHKWDDQLWLDDQACNGLRLWLENFTSLTVVAVLFPDSEKMSGYTSIDSIEERQRLNIITLPYAYTPLSFSRGYKRTIKLISDLIDSHQYLSFAIGGFWGDWGSFACLQACKKKRKYSVWTDRVESDVILHRSKSEKGLKRAYYYILAKLAENLNNKAVKKSALGLFHGNDCYNTYSPLSKTSFCVHDIHLSNEYHITDEEIQVKIKNINSDRPFKILYAGRLDPMKGPDDWIDVMELLVSEGYSLQAGWAGEGNLMDSLNLKIRNIGIEGSVELMGLVADHDKLIDMMKKSDLFVFCHKTQESPRCLIEALISGCPIAGYWSHYPADLVSKYGGGLFVEKDDIRGLSDCIGRIISDKELRASLIREASISGRLFSDTAVFKERSDLIKKHL